MNHHLVVASAGAVFLLPAAALTPVVSSSPCCFQSVGESLGVTTNRRHVPWLSTRHRHGYRETTRTRYLLGFLLAPPPSITSSRQESSSCRESSPPSSVVTRLLLDQQFNRWRLLQELLEAEAEGGDVNEVLYRVLKSFLDIPRPKRIVDSEGITRSNTSPIIGAKIRTIIQSLVDNAESSRRTISIFTSDCSVQSMEILADVEKLLPDPIEDEDAHKTCWDLVMEMHGKEAVKAEEVERNTDWRARCSVARVLIHFDFLDAGVIESGHT